MTAATAAEAAAEKETAGTGGTAAEVWERVPGDTEERQETHSEAADAEDRRRDSKGSAEAEGGKLAAALPPTRSNT